MIPGEFLSSNILFKDGRKGHCSKNIPRNLDAKQNSSSVPTYQSLISPKTLLNNSKETLWGQNSRTVTAQTAAGLSPTFTVNGSHVLCSTTVGCFSHLPQPNQALQTGLLGEEEDAELLLETEERCSSYDDVLFEWDDAVNETDKQWDPEYISDFDSGFYEWDDHSCSEDNITLEDGVIVHATSTKHNPRMQHNAEDSSLICKSIGVSKSHVNVFDHTNGTKQHLTTSESETSFAVPQVVDWSKINESKTGQITSPELQPSLGGPRKSVQTNLVSSVLSKPFRPEKTSTPNTSTTRHKPTITKRTEPLMSPVTICTEPKQQAAHSSSSFGSRQILNNILSCLPTNTLSYASHKGPLKITSPLCACGRRAKRQVVTNGGPNHGRGFYCCPVRCSGGRGRTKKRCEFFKWESALMKSSSVETPSTSFYLINSTVPHRAPPRKSY